MIVMYLMIVDRKKLKNWFFVKDVDVKVSLKYVMVFVIF